MDEMERQEYKALRATIRERGSVRVVTFLAALLGWAVLTVALLIGFVHASALLVSLLVLAGGFEAVFQVHLGVERVGRYLQVAYEERRAAGAAADATVTAGWETTAMAYGRAYAASGSDPLFARVFLLAALLNLLSVIFTTMGQGVVFAVIAAAHVAFALRVFVAKRRAGRQRAEDLERFRALLGARGAGGASPS